jgi:PKD domain
VPVTTTTSTLPGTRLITTTTVAPGPAAVSASDSGLTFEVMATPVDGPVSTAVVFTIVAKATHANGALHYDVQYGDGSGDADAVPQYCVAAPGPPASQTWTLSHQYSAPGTYTVTVTVAVNCSGLSATATLKVSRTAA